MISTAELINLERTIGARNTGGGSLQHFLSLTAEELSSRLTSDDLVAAATDNEKKFAAWMNLSHWPQLSSEVAEHVCGFLQEDAIGLFAGAWFKYKELLKCAQETLERPGSTLNVELADHKFTYKMEPAVEVRLDGNKVATIPFKLELELAVGGLELHLKDGCVDAVRRGRCTCEARILCADHTVWTTKRVGIDLLSELKFAKPISLVSSGSL